MQEMLMSIRSQPVAYVIGCKSSMQYSIPKCLSHIPNPLETVPSAQVTIERLELNDSSKFHGAEWE